MFFYPVGSVLFLYITAVRVAPDQHVHDLVLVCSNHGVFGQDQLLTLLNAYLGNSFSVSPFCCHCNKTGAKLSTNM